MHTRTALRKAHVGKLRPQYGLEVDKSAQKRGVSIIIIQYTSNLFQQPIVLVSSLLRSTVAGKLGLDPSGPIYGPIGP